MPLYLNNNSLSPVSNDIAHLLEPNKIAFPFVSKSPPSWGVGSATKSVGAIDVTFAFAPVPSANSIAVNPVATATVLPPPPPCFTVAV